MVTSLKDRLKQCQKRRTAILATNFYNLETLQAILIAAMHTKSSVILQLTQSSIEYMGLDMAIAMARQGLKDAGVEGWIHLDHGGSVELVKRCLDAGFDSVMIDASEKPLEENIRITSTVVDIAKAYGANVEAELGYVAKIGQEQDKSFTSVEEAVAFVSLTGIDSLAIAIGSAHGFYKSIPKLDIPRLASIHRAIDTILVLHGSSGIPQSMIREAINNGISKINLATEIKDSFMRALRDALLNTNEIDLRKVFPNATLSVVELLKDKYNVVKC